MSDDPKPPPDIATKIMAAMVRMPPKPHDEMKVGRRKTKAKPDVKDTKNLEK